MDELIELIEQEIRFAFFDKYFGISKNVRTVLGPLQV